MLSDLVAEVQGAVVIVECPDTDTKGSGFFVSPEGHIVTNNHVVAEPSTQNGVLVFKYSDDIRVSFAGNQYSARVESDTNDPRPNVYDYAILRVNRVPNAGHLRIGDPGAIRPGDEILCLGFPLDFESLIATSGIVCAVIKRESHINSLHQMRSIVTDALIQFGHSGGPLVHVDTGAVIGINTLRHELRDVIAQRLRSWSSSPIAADFPLIRDLIDFTLKYTYVGLNHAISVEHVVADPSWPNERRGGR